MERVLTVSQMQKADKFTIENLGVGEDVLVERAGFAVADEITKRFAGGRVLVCVGKGNNGADGKVIAEILSKKHGFSVSIINVYNGIFKAFERKYDIIVDCIFGTGLNREVEGKYKKAIELINQSGAFIVSCDIASGINGDSGKIMGVAVKANLTVAIQEYKLGHFINYGIDYSGEVVARDIGISVWDDQYIKRLNDKSVSNYFKPTNRNVHKGNFGKCAIIGGSKDYSGSVILTTNALCSFKMGAGYVTMVVPESLFSAYVGKVPEIILTAIKDCDGKMTCDKETLSRLLQNDCIAIGMGMGVSEGGYQIIKFLLQNYEGKLVIDADGLNCLATFGSEILKEKKCQVVLTPHVGEFCRLANISKEDLLENTIKITTDFARHNDLVVVLKSAVSVISDGNNTFINTTGCQGMAKGGSGDVLSGVIAGLLARNDDVTETTAAACYLFGRAGEIAQSEQNQFTMTASDIILAIRKAINKII
ncbi:MAG: NAD(P)H-hydrate dehydratase [Clostridiales bacterium]|nr:NAD(P)H-hydrate dehydratase [Clostridiales bacterium]